MGVTWGNLLVLSALLRHPPRLPLEASSWWRCEASSRAREASSGLPPWTWTGSGLGFTLVWTACVSAEETSTEATQSYRGNLEPLRLPLYTRLLLPRVNSRGQANLAVFRARFDNTGKGQKAFKISGLPWIWLDRISHAWRLESAWIRIKPR